MALSIVNDGVGSIIRRSSVFFLNSILSALTGALILRVVQRNLSHQPLSWQPDPSLRNRASVDGLGSMVIRLLGIQLRPLGPSTQASQDRASFFELYRTRNRRDCESLLAEMGQNKKTDWLIPFTKNLGPKLNFFYEPNLSSADSTQRSIVLKLILRLDDTRQEVERIYPYFADVVKAVVGPSLQNLCEKQVVCIEKTWSYLNLLDRRRAYTLLEAVLETHPSLLDIFVQAVFPEGVLLNNLNLTEVTQGLEEVKEVLLFNPDFSASFSVTQHPELKKMTFVNMRAIIGECAKAYNKHSIPAAIGGKLGADMEAGIEQIYAHYQKYLSIYSIDVYLAAAEEVWINRASASSTSSSSSAGFISLGNIWKDFAQKLLTMSDLEKDEIANEIAAICFIKYVQQSLQKIPGWGSDDLNRVVTRLTTVLDPLQPMFKLGPDAQGNIQKVKILQGVKVLVIDAGHLFHHGVDLDFICATIDIRGHGGLLLLANEDIMNRIKIVLRQLRLDSNPLRPVVVPAIETTAITPAQRGTVLAKIKENPFLCLSKLVVPFIRQLLPDQQALVDNFEEKMGVLQPFFNQSSLRQEIINAISDPVIFTFIEQNGLSGPFSNFLNTTSERLQALFLKISKGEPLGHTPIAEEPLRLFIGKIHEAHEQRKLMWANKQEHTGVRGKILLEHANVEKVQSWLINDLPREVQTMKTATNILSVVCPFLGFSIGQFNFGTPLMAHVLGIVSGVLKLNGVVDHVVEKICENEPNSPLAKFLKGLEPKEKESLIPFLQDQVIPLITALAPVLEKRHKLKMYVQFFEDLNGLIQNDNGNIDEDGEKMLQQRLAQVLSQLSAELKGYGPELDKAFKCLWESE